METCTTDGCVNKVSKAGHKLCLKHWKESCSMPPEVAKEATGYITEAPASAVLTATALGEKYNLSPQKINLALQELGWINKDNKGWAITQQGQLLHAEQKSDSRTAIPFVMWPEAILNNKALQNSIREIKGEAEVPAPEKNSVNTSMAFRQKFPAMHRSTDGHMVRSKSEILIDNWLYMNGIVHAYERKLPIEEDVYCDFYIPEGNVYIEYWGLEEDPKYMERKKTKLRIYEARSFNLIQLSEEHIKNLDDLLPQLLLKHGVEFN